MGVSRETLGNLNTKVSPILRVGSRSFELQTVVLTCIAVFQGDALSMIQNPTLKIQIQKFSLGRKLAIWKRRVTHPTLKRELRFVDV